MSDTVLYAVMKKSRMVEPAFFSEKEANEVCEAYKRDARDGRYQVRMITVHEPPEWLAGDGESGYLPTGIIRQPENIAEEERKNREASAAAAFTGESK